MRQSKNIKDVSDKELIYSESYFTSVFKKTEGIVSAVFYILSDKNDKDKNFLISETKQTALAVLRALSDTLTAKAYAADRELLSAAKELTKLASLTQVLVASEQVHPTYGSMILEEIRMLLRNIDQYRAQRGQMPLAGFREYGKTTPRAPQQSSGETHVRQMVVKDSAPQKDRKDRIKEILAQKGKVSIKDISANFTGTSEKSIQRDLNELIAVGEVKRQGERRWSMYFIDDAASGGAG